MEGNSVEVKEKNDALKLLAIITMLIDHIGYMLFPQQLILRAIGRIAFPIFAHQLVIGYRKTSSLKNYALRLGAFAFISQLPFYFFGRGLNIFFTLLTGLAAIYLYESKSIKNRIILLFILVFTAAPPFSFLKMDYGAYGVLTILICHIFYERKTENLIAFGALTLLYCLDAGFYLQMWAVAAVPFFYVDWKFRVSLNKYFFYVFYPLHITLLVLIVRYMI